MSSLNRTCHGILKPSYTAQIVTVLESMKMWWDGSLFYLRA